MDISIETQEMDHMLKELRKSLRVLSVTTHTLVRHINKENQQAIQRFKEKQQNVAASHTNREYAARLRVFKEAQHNLNWMRRENPGGIQNLAVLVDQALDNANQCHERWLVLQGRPIPKVKPKESRNIHEEQILAKCFEIIVRTGRVRLDTRDDASWFAFSFLPTKGYHDAGIYRSRTVYLDGSEMPSRRHEWNN